MAQSSWPTPDNGHVVDDFSYERLGLSYGAVAGQIGIPTATDVVYADSTGLQVKIRSGRYAAVRGFTWYSGSSDFTKTISANSSGSTRIDLVVLRLNRSTWNVTCEVVNGTPGAGTPPALTQNTGSTGVWELPLATVTVANSASTIAAGNVTALPIFLAPDSSGFITYAATTPILTSVQGYIPTLFAGCRLYNQFDATVSIYTGAAWRSAEPDVQAFDANGTWTKPAGAQYVLVELVGGGGGGGGITGAGSGVGQGGGGGGGGYVRKMYHASDLSATQAVTVGAAGTAGVGSSAGTGGTGGNSTFAALTGSGGSGGSGGTASTSSGTAGLGNGGAATGGDLNIAGQDGTLGRWLASSVLLFNGNGGGTMLAPMTSPSISTSTDGQSSVTGYGGGGSGAVATTTSRNGGAGRPGRVIVTTYF